jgi:hypothetical protein
MDITIKGKILSSECVGSELLFRLAGHSKIMKLDLFTGCRLFKIAKGLKAVEKTIYDILRGARFEAVGHCYNSEMLVVDFIKLDDEFKKQIDSFLVCVKEAKSKELK